MVLLPKDVNDHFGAAVELGDFLRRQIGAEREPLQLRRAPRTANDIGQHAGVGEGEKRALAVGVVTADETRFVVPFPPVVVDLNGTLDLYLTANGNIVGAERRAEFRDFWTPFNVLSTDPVAVIGISAFADVNADGLLDIIAPLDREGLTRDQMVVLTRQAPYSGTHCFNLCRYNFDLALLPGLMGHLGDLL